MGQDHLNPQPVQAQYRASAPTFVAGTTNPLQQDINGNLKVAVSGTAGSVLVEGVYNVSPPAPVNGSPYYLQINANGELVTHDTSVTNSTTSILSYLQASQAVAGASASLPLGIQGVAGAVAVAISAASLPLPAGAATSAIQATMQTSLSAIQVATGLTSTTPSGSDGDKTMTAGVSSAVISAATRATLSIQNTGAANNVTLCSAATATLSGGRYVLGPLQSVYLQGAEASLLWTGFSTSGTTVCYAVNT